MNDKVSIASLTGDAVRVDNLIKRLMDVNAKYIVLTRNYDRLLYAAENASNLNMTFSVFFSEGVQTYNVARNRDELYSLILADMRNQIVEVRRIIEDITKEILG